MSSIQRDAIFPASDRSHVTIRKKKRVLPEDDVSEDVKPQLKLMKTGEIIEVITLSSDCESEPDGNGADLSRAKEQVLPADEDCSVCRLYGPPKSGAHKCAHCQTAVHVFGCSAPNPGGVEGSGGSDRLCWPCFHKVNDQQTKPKHAKDPLPQAHNETCCSVCELPVVGSCQCTYCFKYVHAEECSMRNPNGSDDRICTNCFCLLCKSTTETGHVCQCHICDLPAPITEGVLCYRCEKITHPEICAKSIRAKEKLNELRFICMHCLYSLTVGVSVIVKAQLMGNQMLSDEHIVRASVMLAAQFGDKVDGFCAPMVVTYGKRVEDTNYYPRRTSNDLPWVQIMNTGQHHWVTAVFEKGSSVKIIDSMRSKPISGHTKIQVAMIMFSKERITVCRTPCKQQDNGIDCGLFAIANATEYCFTSEIQYVDFDHTQLRSHWLMCLEKGTISQFPRFSKRPKKVKEQEEFEIVSPFCTCRLPANYSNLISCDDCSSWFHRLCVGLEEDGPEEVWICGDCLGKL